VKRKLQSENISNNTKPIQEVNLVHDHFNNNRKHPQSADLHQNANIKNTKISKLKNTKNSMANVRRKK